MPHQRQVIAEKVRDLLLGQTVAGDRVFVNRHLPVREDEVPAILVYPALTERVDPESEQTAPRELTRRADFLVVGLVPAPDDGEGDAEAKVLDATNDIAVEIERVMHGDQLLGGVAAGSILTGSELETDTVGDRLIGGIGLTYEVTYRTLAPEPPAAETFDRFRTANTTFNLGGAVHADDVVEDQVVVQPEAPPP